MARYGSCAPVATRAVGATRRRRFASSRSREGLRGMLPAPQRTMSDFETIPATELGAATGGADFTFQGKGTTTQAACFTSLGRGIAHSFGDTGPWVPHSAMRPDEHLILDKQNNEVGVARW